LPNTLTRAPPPPPRSEPCALRTPRSPAPSPGTLRGPGPPPAPPCAHTAGCAPPSSSKTKRRPPRSCASTSRRRVRTSPRGGAVAVSTASGRRRRSRRPSGVRAFVVSAPGRYGLAEVPDPRPGPGEVLIAPAAVGICGSDLELLDGRRPADYVRYPVVPRHEWS